MLGGFIEEITGGHPSRYAVRPGFAPQVVALLFPNPPGSQRVPEWTYWFQVFSVLLQIASWTREPQLVGSAYLLSSRARDLNEQISPVLRAQGLRLPRPQAYPGAAYLEPWVEAITRWWDTLEECIQSNCV